MHNILCSLNTMSIYTQPANVSICFSWFVNFPTYQTNVITLFTHLSDLSNHCPILHAREPRGPGPYSPSTQAPGLLVLSLPLARRNRCAWWGCGCMLSDQQSECRRWRGEWSSMGGGQEEVSTMRTAFLGRETGGCKRGVGQCYPPIEPTTELGLIIKPEH